MALLDKVIINSRADYDALSPEQQDAFRAKLVGSIYRLERDDLNQTWIAVQDTTTISRFGLAISDFPDVTPPELPVWEPIDDVPKVISMRQCRLQLLASGFLDTVDQGITDTAAKIEWEYATTVERQSPLVSAMAALLGLTEAQVDDLFRQAEAL